ncbi:DUF438 domain-containing protein [Alkaliphilus sp. MSJ-5]|uniref:DUF438 domain-containing protein n=1 Tax=Alkaliphilus flagellatus TaxID=2841507 RepID=A0ABS6G457_9FIRM|nr:DUF438 domain-containing protein [Alkaliphilus flagellatus]MBU5677262.1 DUF438 domain-containing protein [Alkaliphilus flagellatus]
MSELINNREHRKEILKGIIKDLHAGKEPRDVKERFAQLIKEVSPTEISEMEQSLMLEGMEIGEIQKLCDVHAEIFKGSIAEVHSIKSPDKTLGHPVHTFKIENREIEKLITETINPQIESIKQSKDEKKLADLNESLKRLLEIDKHYSRKENLLFPYLEKYEITAPPQVMWGVDDEIRANIKEARNIINQFNGQWDVLFLKLEEAINGINEMIFKEENILFPMSVETLTEDEWFNIAEESAEIGYCLTEPIAKWKPEKTESYKEDKKDIENIDVNKDMLQFESGMLTFKQIELMLNHLPIDITFIDENDTFKYFSLGKERIFARTKSAIGRDVHNCHPPASVHIVEKILNDFKSGKKDSEEFWIQMGPTFVYIRYFAVRDENGKYMGTVEVTQNIKPIQGITGEKRLLSDIE